MTSSQMMFFTAGGGAIFGGWVAWYQNPGAAGTSGLSRARAVVADPSGNVYFGFYVWGAGGGSGIYCGIMKMNSSGTVQWTRQLAPPVATGYMYCRGIAIDSSSNLYVCMAYNNAGVAREPSYVAKYNSSGTIQWQRQLTNTTQVTTSLGNYGIGAQYAGTNIATMGHNSVVISSTGYSNFSVVSRAMSTGSINAQKTLGAASTNGASFDSPYGCVINAAGDIFVTGTSSENSFGGQDLVVAKYQTGTGTLLWNNKLGNASGNAQSGQPALDASDNLYVCATDGMRSVLTKWNSSGTLQFQIYETTHIYVFKNICVDSLGNIYAVGYYSGSNSKVAICKVNSSGTMQWLNYIEYTGVTDSSDHAIGMMQSGTGKDDYIYVSTSVTTNTPNYYVFGAKLPTDGSRTGFFGSFGAYSVQYLAGTFGGTTAASMSTTGFGGADATSTFTDSAGAGIDNAVSPATVTQLQTFP